MMPIVTKWVLKDGEYVGEIERKLVIIEDMPSMENIDPMEFNKVIHFLNERNAPEEEYTTIEDLDELPEDLD